MRFAFVALAIVGTLQTTHAIAAKSPKGVVPLLPIVSLRGVQLGTSFPGDMSECPKRIIGPTQSYISSAMPDFPDDMKGKVCFGDDSGRTFLDNLQPLKWATNEVDVDLIDGKIEQVRMEFGINGYTTILAGLTQKYGKPRLEQVEHFHNGFGAQYSGRSAMWVREENYLIIRELEPVVGNADTGIIILTSSVYKAHLDKNKKSGADDAAKHL